MNPAITGSKATVSTDWETLPNQVSAGQLVQAKATLSSDFGPNHSDERATMRPPKAR